MNKQVPGAGQEPGSVFALQQGGTAVYPIAPGASLQSNSQSGLLAITRNRVLAGVFLAVLACLVWFSSHLAAIRIYQVDECQNIFMARILATGQASEFFTNGSLFLLGPLSWISKNATSSADIFNNGRLIFLGVYWLNLALIALIASEKLYSLKGLIALVAAATLAPLWDYGLEIRHDNLILTGMLLTWWIVRVKPMRMISYAVAGAIVVASLFIAVKAVVYVLPLSFMLLAFPPSQHQCSRFRLLLAWMMGALLAMGAIRLFYGSGGAWELYFSVFHGVTKYSASGAGRGAGFGPWVALARLLTQTPLLLALGVAAVFAFCLDLLRRKRNALNWSGNLPEVLLVFGVLGVLMVNPTPFPYNLLHVVPYVFVLVFRYGVSLCEQSQQRENILPVAGGVLVFCHIVPFGVATARHLQYDNFRQGAIMQKAEAMTDPLKDPVYDAIGMVPTRSAIHFQWYLHSLNIRSFVEGNGLRVREMLAARPAAVFIPNYRTDWLPDEDHDFIRQHFVSLADDFWVLGNVLPIGGGTFEIIHPGRYRLSSLECSDIAGTYPTGYAGLTSPEADVKVSATLDGRPITNGIVQLEAGSHRIESASGMQPAVVWVGPQLNRPHRFGVADHQRLFVNWY